MKKAFISIGSNIGDRLDHLKQSTRALHSHEGISVLSVSSIYETAPVGYTDQADFLNLTTEIETELSAHALLTVCQEIEQELGRVRDIRWGPRTVDLDILLYNNESIEIEDLVVPHPRMHLRAFVLIPLLEIAPTIVHPVTSNLYSDENAVHDGGVEVWQKVMNVDEFLL